MNGTDERTVEERLSNFGLGFFGYGILAAVVTIAAGWPAQFGGPGDPANVLAEFLSRGTAAAPPLLPLLLLGGGAMIVRRSGRWGTAAAVLLVVLGVLFVIGGFGEILAPNPVTTPRPVLLVAGVIAIVGGAALASGGISVLVAKRRSKAQGS